MSRWFHFFLEATVGIYVKLRFSIVTENFEQQYSLRSPYIVLANHSSNWDPFFVNFTIHTPMYFVASDTHFRSTLGAWGLNLVGAIPKTKGMADMRSIQNIIKVSRDGGVLGIFAEGECCWSGDSIAPIASTAKLLKMLCLPVVVVNISGAFFVAGRWSRYIRRGTIHLRMRPAISTAEINRMSTDELYQVISKQLEVKQSEEQQHYRTEFRGKSPAQYLERSLFVCPSCNQIGTLYSTPSTLICKKCRYQVKYTSRGDFAPVKGELRFSTISQWFRWQTAFFQKIIERINDTQKIILQETGMKIFRASGDAPFQKQGVATATLFFDRMEIENSHDKKVFSLQEVQGFNIQKNEQIEFYHHSLLYKLRPASPHSCTVAWQIAVFFLQSRQ